MIATFAKIANTTRAVQSLTGIGKTLARRIVKDLGGGDEQTAIKVLTTNPYRLVDVDGIAFTKADRIATKDFNLELDDTRRHEAGNQHIVGQYGPITWAAFRKYRRELSLYNPERERDGIVEDRNLVWLSGELMCEKFLARWIRNLYDSSRDWKSTFQFGAPDASLTDLDGVQAGAVMFALENPWRVMMLTGDAGTGKCLGRGTPVMKFDGTVVPVEVIKVGDLLMGPDSRPRRVLSLARGREPLYKIKPIKGDPYVVNESHILSLKMSSPRMQVRHGEIVNISVRDFLKKGIGFQAEAKSWRTAIDFTPSGCPVDPYILGIWLGDGSSHAPHITTADPEIKNALQAFADASSLNIRVVRQCGKAIMYGLISEEGIKKSNSFINGLRGLNVFGNKHVPHIYKATDKQTRLQLLAGLLDADGHLDKQGHGFDFINANENIARDVAFIARSLGLAAYVKECTKSCQYKGEIRVGIYYRVSISGDVGIIPTKVKRKQAGARAAKKDVLKVGIQLEALGEGDYFGFEIDGDKLFLLGDFTVTHNTHVISNIAKLAHKRGLTTQVLAFAGKAADRAREALEKSGAPAGASTIHRALRLGRDGTMSTPNELGADIVIIDEASMIPNWLFAMVIMSLKPKARLVIVGDEAQLPPIGYGTPFCDMLALKLPMIRLAKNYRQRDQLGILEVAKSIRDRTSYPDFEQDAAVRIRAVGDEWIQVANDIIENVKTRALNWDEWQVVTFKNNMREQLNQGIQETVNPAAHCLFTVKAWTLDEKELEIRVGDKVIVTKNDYECDVFNGQIGVVIRLEERLPLDLDARANGEKQLGVLLEMRGQERWIPLDMATELLTLGYAITCHKAQGSGWQNVIVIQPDRVNGESNKWWYTACTRAENQLTIISSMSLDTLWQNAIQRSSSKDSSLFERVREASRVNN